MSVLLVCPKDSGNTFNVANYVTNNSDAELLLLNQNQEKDLNCYNSIILCSGLYGSRVHKLLQRWLAQIKKTSINENAKIYLFLTWFGIGKSDKEAIREVKNILEEKKMSLEKDYMTCLGKGLVFVRSNHPNKEDYKKILNWVKSK